MFSVCKGFVALRIAVCYGALPVVCSLFGQNCKNLLMGEAGGVLQDRVMAADIQTIGREVIEHIKRQPLKVKK